MSQENSQNKLQRKSRISFFQNKYPDFEVETGENLMFELLRKDIPVASSCHGDGICSKCRIKIVNGAENLSLETEHEKFLKNKNNIPQDWRISCQTQVNGDLTIDTNYW